MNKKPLQNKLELKNYFYYPPGLLPALFIWIVFVTIVLLTIFVKKWNYAEAFSTASAIAACLSGFWIILRFKKSPLFKYNTIKFLKNLGNRIFVNAIWIQKWTVFNNFKSEKEYKYFLEQKTKKAKWWAYITAGIFTLLFFSFLIYYFIII